MDQVLSHLSIDFPHAQFLRVEAEELPEISKAYSVSDVPYFVFFKIAAYGKRFMLASQDTWELFQKHEMECIVDSDITTAICFLTGICSGAICIIIMAPWTWSVHSDFTATVSLLAFFIGYLMVPWMTLLINGLMQIGFNQGT